jgi:hypothetical protein
LEQRETSTPVSRREALSKPSGAPTQEAQDELISEEDLGQSQDEVLDIGNNAKPLSMIKRSDQWNKPSGLTQNQNQTQTRMNQVHQKGGEG